MSGAEHGSSSAMRLRTTWRTLGEWVRQPAPAQAGPGILSTLLLILCATYQGGMIGSAVLTGRVGDGGMVGGSPRPESASRFSSWWPWGRRRS